MLRRADWCRSNLSPLSSRFIISANSLTALECDALHLVATKTRFWKQYFRLVNRYICERLPILHIVLYACRAGSLTLREERKLSLFENRVLRKIFGPKRVEVRGDFRGPHNEEFYDLCSSQNLILVIKSRRMRWTGHINSRWGGGWGGGGGGGEVHTGFCWKNVRK